MEADSRVGGERAHLFRNEIGDRHVIGVGQDVIKRLAVWTSYHMNIFLAEGDLWEAIVLTEPVKPSRILGKQRKPCIFLSPQRRDELDFAWYPGGRPRHRKRIERFGYDLR